jgi:hypothetical protein
MKIFIPVCALVAAIAAPQPAAHQLEIPRQSDLTREQALQRADERFDQFDLNHDGVVTREEAQRLGPKLLLRRAMTGRDVAAGIGGHTLRFLKRRFAGVEAVTKEQFEAAFLAHFDEMDVNHDGVLSPEEREEGH